MKHLFSCLRRFKAECVLAPLFKLLEASLELITPLIVALIVDRGIAEGDKSFIVLMCLVLVGHGARRVRLLHCGAVLRGARRGGVLGRAEESALPQTAVLLLLRDRRDGNIHHDHPHDERRQPGADGRQYDAPSPFCVRPSSCSARWRWRSPSMRRWRSSLLPSSRSLAVAVYSVMGALHPSLQKGAVEARPGVFLSVRENLAGVRVIRAFSMEEKERCAFDGHTHELERAQKKVGRISALTGPHHLHPHQPGAHRAALFQRGPCGRRHPLKGRCHRALRLSLADPRRAHQNSPISSSR